MIFSQVVLLGVPKTTLPASASAGPGLGLYDQDKMFENYVERAIVSYYVVLD